MDLRVRLLTTEQLDNLSLSGKPLQKTLSSLKLINSFFGNHRQLYKAIEYYCKNNTSKNKFHIVDIGCGGGDCIYHIFKKLKRQGISASFTGIDGNPDSITYAIKQNKDPESINFKVDDILHKDFKIPNCDLLISSHFIYHFTDNNLILFFKKIKQNEIPHIIFSELYRSKTSYYLFKVVRHILPISNIAKRDGLTAIQRAFSINELQKVIHQSDIQKFKIHKKAFFRMIINITP